MTHPTELIHRGGLTVPYCHTCGCGLSDPCDETEAIDIERYHRRVEAPRIEGRAA